ncbi:MAG: bacteriocin leader domain-containing protein [Gammaproteobacteria bacterium]|nr:MAG: bacteriocin leader domain-containing protein [Gammaproteobacteria bacterium]
MQELTLNEINMVAGGKCTWLGAARWGIRGAKVGRLFGPWGIAAGIGAGLGFYGATCRNRRKK